MKKHEEAKALLSNKQGPAAGFEEVFEAVLDEFIDKKSPHKRRERRHKRTGGAGHAAPGNGAADPDGKAGGNGTVKPNGKAGGNGSPKRKRHIPSAVRDDVFARDGGRCTFTGTGGKQCGSRFGLHVDHIVPFAKGGSSDPSNLRLLCANHNQLEAERSYGKEFMQQYHRRE